MSDSAVARPKQTNPGPQSKWYRTGRGARRFPIRMVVYYRVGEGRWHQGCSHDLSANGVLFQASYPPPENMPLEIRLVVEFDVPLERPPEIVCWGRVVRLQSPSVGEDPLVAASLRDFRFLSHRQAAAVASRLRSQVAQA